MRSHNYYNTAFSGSKKVIPNFFITLRKNLSAMFNKSKTIASLHESIKNIGKKYDERIEGLNKIIADHSKENEKLTGKINFLKKSISSFSSLSHEFVDHKGDMKAQYNEVSQIVSHLVRLYAIDGDTNVIDAALKNVIDTLVNRIENLVETLRSEQNSSKRYAIGVERTQGELNGVNRVLGGIKMEYKVKSVA